MAAENKVQHNGLIVTFYSYLCQQKNMDIKEQNQIVREMRQLNKASRVILKQMQATNDHEEFMTLKAELEAINHRFNEIVPTALKTLEENENPPKNETPTVTPLLAQFIWENIRRKIRLAKFNDEGIELPQIDMKKLFNGCKRATVQEISDQLQDIINKWQPT